MCTSEKLFLLQTLFGECEILECYLFLFFDMSAQKGGRRFELLTFFLFKLPLEDLSVVHCGI
jgi:hypothetical protein